MRRYAQACVEAKIRERPRRRAEPRLSSEPAAATREAAPAAARRTPYASVARGDADADARSGRERVQPMMCAPHMSL